MGTAWHRSIHRPAMRGRIPLESASRSFPQLIRHQIGVQKRRALQISATPTTDSPILSGDALSNAIDASSDSPGIRRSYIVTETCSNWVRAIRCTFRGSRRSLLSFIGFLVSLAKAVHQEGHVSRSQWEGRKCQ